MKYNDEKPFFLARMRNGKIDTKGEPDCSLGHKLGDEQSDCPDDVYLDWHFDGEELTVKNDKFGFFHCFYYQDADSIVLSPSMVSMIPYCRNRDLDEEALSVFLRNGTIFNF